MTANTRNKTATSITDRLSRIEWNPQPGDTVEGVIVAITARSIITKEDHRELWFPVIALDLGDGQPGVTVDCGRGGLADPVIAARPKIGRRIGFRFIGPVDNPKTGKTWDKYAVEFEDEPPEPDWDKMAAARGGWPASQATTGNQAPWDDSAEPPADEPPW